jgi:hypothetical protein
MAKLSAHGAIIGTIEYTAKTLRYMEDGKVLVNFGDGWKIRGKLKDWVSPHEAYAKAVQKQKDYLAARPALVNYRKLLHDLAPLSKSKRAKLHTCVDIMPEDCDRVWSEACDGYGDNIHASVDEVAALCAAYKAVIAEQKYLDKETAQSDQ